MKLISVVNVLLSLSLLILSGCASSYEELGPPTLRLSSAVQGVCEKPNVYGFPENGNSSVLLKLATEDDPSLLDPFADVAVKSKCLNQDSVLMICDKDGYVKLFEDFGCTTAVDIKDFDSEEPCEFTRANKIVSDYH